MKNKILTSRYIDKLIYLAKEIEINTDCVAGEMDKDQVKWMSKINYLLGYILALETTQQKPKSLEVLTLIENGGGI
jgi:hypothetical protein